MTQPVSTSRRAVALSAVAVLLTAAAFGAAFYLLDGASLALPYVDMAIAWFYPQPEPPAATTEGDEPDLLETPEGMSDEFALTLWQEQLDSQPTISRLVSGDVKSLKIDKVQRLGDEARLIVTVNFVDDTKGPGVIGLRRFDDVWYVAYAEGTRSDDATGAAASMGRGSSDETTDRPDVEEVDTELLNTIIAENKKSSGVLDEYVAGIVKEVNIEEVTMGPSTATLKIGMDETHGEGYARLVAIKKVIEGRTVWFLANFTKTGHEPPNL